MSDIDPFAAEAVNEITPSNIRGLIYWLASTIVVVTVFITTVYIAVTALQAHAEEITIAVGGLSDAQIITNAKVDSHKALADQTQAENERRFMELLRRVDASINQNRN